MSEDAGEESNNLTKLILLVIAVAAAAGLFFLTQQEETEPEPVALVVPEVRPVERLPVEAEQAPETMQEVLAPLAENPQVDESPIASPSLPLAPPPEPLPDLHQSDPAAIEQIKTLAVGDKLLKLIVPDSVILKFVRAMIALDEGTVVNDYRPLVSPPPPFKTERIDEPLVEQVGQSYRLSEANYRRYEGMVNVFEGLESTAVVNAYQRFLPLFEEAYAQQGLSTGGFNQVALRVIDNFLAAPIIEEELILVQPKVFYQFQEVALEELPDSQKLLLRMGPESTRRIQGKLKELKALLSQ